MKTKNIFLIVAVLAGTLFSCSPQSVEDIDLQSPRSKDGAIILST